MQNIVYSLEKRKPLRAPCSAPRRRASTESQQPEPIPAALTFLPLGAIANVVVARLAQRCRITPDHARVAAELNGLMREAS